MELDLELSYYNETLAVWEPLLEPVYEAEGKYRPWKLLLKVFTTNYQNYILFENITISSLHMRCLFSHFVNRCKELTMRNRSCLYLGFS